MYRILALLLLTGCASEPFGPYLGEPKPFIEVDLVHHHQPWMDEVLKDESKSWCNGEPCRWMGNNPRIHGEIGLEWKPKTRWINTIQCPAIITGTSLAVGAPFKQNKPELYWSYVKCGFKVGGYD